MPGIRRRPRPSAGVGTVHCCLEGRGGRGGATSLANSPGSTSLAHPAGRSRGAKMNGEENPASKPTPVQDVQGDGRWMSLVSDPARDTESGRGLRRAAGWRHTLCGIRKLRVVGVVEAERRSRVGRAKQRAFL